MNEATASLTQALARAVRHLEANPERIRVNPVVLRDTTDKGLLELYAHADEEGRLSIRLSLEKKVVWEGNPQQGTEGVNLWLEMGGSYVG